MRRRTAAGLSAWDFTWLFATRPLSLGDGLRAAGLKNLTAPVGRYFGQGGSADAYAKGMLGVLFLGAPSCAFTVAGGLALAHFRINWLALALCIAVSAAFGLLIALVKDLAMGATASLIGATAAVGAFGLAYGGSLGASAGNTALVVRGAFEGAAAGWFLGSYAALVLRRPLKLVRVQLASILIPVLGFAFWAWRSQSMRGAASAIGCIVAFPVCALRLPSYPLEALAQTLLFWREARTGRSTLERSPIFLQEIAYLRLPFLRRHIELALKTTPPLGRLALLRCLRLPAEEQWASARFQQLIVKDEPGAGGSPLGSG